MSYSEVQQRCSERINNVPIQFAFSKTQFTEACEKLGTHDTSKLCRVPGGGIMLKEQVHLLTEAIDANEADRKAFLEDDDNLLEALEYELGNYEYCITRDADDALNALDLSRDDERVRRLLSKAIRSHMATADS